MKELAKNFDPRSVEKRIYGTWREKGYFKPDDDRKKETFTIVIPPPNVTGQLHMGHALDETLQDILIRYKRMKGYAALWVPGTDHAGIATQIKVEENLRVNEGLTRYDLGRDKFLERVWAWKNKYGSRIIEQLETLGSSCDWDRLRFTMDDGLSAAVREVFTNLYEKGLIYRGYRIINWCPHCRTALSDAEVEYAEDPGHFWYIRYPVKDSDEYVTVATTRPETMLGDTAVAVNPEDDRFAHLVGKTLILPLVGREIPVVADDYVDREFGTGCVKITPAHDPNDFLVGQRHDLPVIRMMNDDATISAEGGKYAGMDRYECRRAILEDLNAGGYLVKTEDHVHNVGKCYRCGTTVEPLTSDQWFVKMGPMIQPAIDAVKEGRIKFVPERFTKTYINWMENLHDWCISRQLWWGHRIPAFYCDACGEMTVSRTDITTCPHCGAPVRQDEDVLDTWFSSALWPFSTLGWPQDTEDLKRFFPTDVLVTGYDIISFWVSRMIFSSIEQTGKEPFSTVFIHGLVRDALGRKMSKSLGNGIDPIEIIEKYGADALRFALATGNSPGNDMRFSDEKIEAARNFTNKIWNAARFVLMNLSTEDLCLPDAEKLHVEDKWILSVYNRVVSEVTANTDKFEIGVALSKLYDFVWDVFCDWYIELIKPRLLSDDKEERENAQRVILYVLTGTLKMLHPYMPFVTEELYQAIPHDTESIMISRYPESDPSLSFPEDEQHMAAVIEAIRAIRNRRAEMNVAPSKKASVFIVTENKDAFNELTSVFFKKLASASDVTVTDGYSDEGSVSIITPSARIYIPLGELVDMEAERKRLEKEAEKMREEIGRVEKKLGNEGFVSKAPAAVIEGERKKLAAYKEKLAGIEETVKKFK
ncbi:MAG: valine--tRNA ligase [Clostridia bacterium]|nr:valine--tRNA ligase [Clostridia bacterium]